MMTCCCGSNFILTLTASKCGPTAYNGVAFVVKQGSTTVFTCTSSGSPCSASLAGGLVYVVTATSPNGIVQTQTFTLTANRTVAFSFIDAVSSSASDICGNPLAGVTLYFSSGSWNDQCVTGAGGTCSVNPTIDLTGATVSVYGTYMNATSPTETFHPTISACSGGHSVFVLSISCAVDSSCTSGPLEGALCLVTGSFGESGSGTTDSAGQCVVTLTQPGVNATVYTLTASKARFATNTYTGAGCVNPAQTLCSTTPACLSVALSPDTGYVCICDCADPAPTVLHGTDPVGGFTMTWSATLGVWIGTATRTVPDAFDNSAGLCNNVTHGVAMTVLYWFSCGLLMKMAACNGSPCYAGCPVPTTAALPTTGIFLGFGGPGTYTCPPAFNWTKTYTMGTETFAASLDGPFYGIFGPPGTVVNFTVTE